MLEPILNAPLTVQIHICAAIPALGLGPVAFLRRRRDWVHRLAGRLWVLAMAVLALSSFGIHGFRMIGPFSPIHLLSLWVLVELVRGIADIRAGRVAAHGARMWGMYQGAIGIAGALTLLPGRIMNRVLFGDAAWLGLLVIGALALLGGRHLVMRARMR